MTRTGKIARLPRAVRDTLNGRLDDGEPGPALVAWLNGLPAVRAVLAERFDGRDITVQNLSEWRQGGYAEWCRQERAMEQLDRMEEHADDVAALPGRPVIDRLETAAALAVAGQLRDAEALEAGPAKTQAVLAAVRAVDRLRRTQTDTARGQRERYWDEREIEQTRVQDETSLAEEQLRAERLLTTHAHYMRTEFKTIREVADGPRPVPAPVLAFFAEEIEFERRHAKAVELLALCHQRRKRGLPLFVEWEKRHQPAALKPAAIPVPAPAAVPTVLAPTAPVVPEPCSTVASASPILPPEPAKPVPPPAPAAAEVPLKTEASAANEATSENSTAHGDGRPPDAAKPEPTTHPIGENPTKSDQIQPQPTHQPAEIAPDAAVGAWDWDRRFDPPREVRPAA